MRHALGDQYVLGDLIGSGGMGLVFVAEQPCLARTVAVKLMRSEFSADTYMLRRFHTEASIGSQLRHPNLVAIVDHGTDDGIPFLVMEYVRGELLGDLLEQQGAFAPRRAGLLVRELLGGLAVAHAEHIVHADIKADNLILTRRNGGELLKLIDFGLARFMDEPTPPFTILSGTPEYLAPELILGARPTPASDVYACGVVLYELLTGSAPFEADDAADVLAMHLDADVVPPSLRNPDAGISDALDAVVLRALAKDPLARFADAQQFADALAAATPDRNEAELRARPSRAAYAAESPTRPDVDHRALRLASGTQPMPRQRPLGQAIAAGDVDEIVTGYLALARRLVDDDSLAGAARELEQAIDLITLGAGPAAPDAPAPLWRLLLTLAAIYDGLGDREHARRAALHAHAQATRCQSSVGRERARALIERLGITRPERMSCEPT